jgi:hypothetical protein
MPRVCAKGMHQGCAPKVCQGSGQGYAKGMPRARPGSKHSNNCDAKGMRLGMPSMPRVCQGCAKGMPRAWRGRDLLRKSEIGGGKGLQNRTLFAGWDNARQGCGCYASVASCHVNTRLMRMLCIPMIRMLCIPMIRMLCIPIVPVTGQLWANGAEADPELILKHPPRQANETTASPASGESNCRRWPQHLPREP